MDVLKNKSYKSYNGLSRYSNFPIYYNSLDNKYVGGTTAYLDNTTIYTLYEVKKGDTFDSIALDAYNNPTYYWIILSYNHIQDPFEEPKEGTYLRIPSKSTIRYDM